MKVEKLAKNGEMVQNSQPLSLFQLIQEVRQEKSFSTLLLRHAKHETSQAYVVAGRIDRKGGVPQLSEGLNVDGCRLHFIYA